MISAAAFRRPRRLRATAAAAYAPPPPPPPPSTCRRRRRIFANGAPDLYFSGVNTFVIYRHTFLGPSPNGTSKPPVHGSKDAVTHRRPALFLDSRGPFPIQLPFVTTGFTAICPLMRSRHRRGRLPTGPKPVRWHQIGHIESASRTASRGNQACFRTRFGSFLMGSADRPECTAQEVRELPGGGLAAIGWARRACILAQASCRFEGARPHTTAPCGVIFRHPSSTAFASSSPNITRRRV